MSFRPPPRAAWVPLLPVAAAMVGVAWVFVWPWLSGQVYADFDLQQQFLPWRIFYQVALDRGDSAIWNPYLARGYDHLAEGQSGLLHPLHWLGYRVLPLTAAITVELLGHLVLAWAGMYLLLRRVGKLVPLAAWTGAALFAGNVFFYAHFMHVNMLWVYAHLPWLLWGIAACADERRGWGAAVGVGLCVASMWLLGHPQTVWYAALGTAVALGAWGLWRGGDATWRRAFARATLGAVAGTLIGLAQLLPTAVGVLNSPRGAVIPASRDNFSLHPVTALLELAPVFLQDRTVRDMILEKGQWKLFNSYQELPAYAGIATLLLLFVGAIVLQPRWWAPGRPRQVTLWLAATLGALCLLALGRYGGLNALLGPLPLVSQFRNPGRYLCVVLCFTAIAAAWVIDRLATGPRPTLTPRRWLLLATPLLVAVALVIANRVALALGHGYLSIHGAQLAFPAQVGPLLVAPLAAAAVLVLLAAYWHRGGLLWLGLLGAVCVGDVAWHCRPVLHGVNRPAPTRPWSDVRAAYHAATTTDHTYRDMAGMNDDVWAGLYLANGYLGIPPTEPLHLEPVGDADPNPRQIAPHLRLAAVRTIHALDAANSNLDKPIPLPRPLPRLRLVPRLQHAAEPLQAVVTIDPTDTALCTPEAAPELDGPPLDPTETVAFTDDGLSTVALTAQVTHPRLIVLADRYDAGWRCTVDGQPATIIPLYAGAIRGIVVQPGLHQVVLTYHSRPLEWGSWFALAGGLVLIGLIVLHLRRGRAWHPK